MVVPGKKDPEDFLKLVGITKIHCFGLLKGDNPVMFAYLTIRLYQA